MVACVGLVALWYITLAPTRIGGPLTPVLVRGTSMLPTYETGDLVVAYRARELRPGQVAVIRAPQGAYVIHRITAVDGDRVVTQGDNRDRPDPWPTTVDDVLGVARLSIPGLGRYVLAVADPLVLAALAGGIAATVVMWPTRPRRRVPDRTGPVTTIVVLMLLPVVASAAGMTVTTDQLASMRITGPYDTYVVNPGGGGGGCNGQGNQPGC